MNRYGKESKLQRGLRWGSEVNRLLGLRVRICIHLWLSTLRHVTSVIRIPVAERSEATVCGRSLVGVAGLSPARDVDFVLCVLHSRDKRHGQDSQHKVVVEMKYREHKKNSPGARMCVLCVAGKGKM